MIPLLLTAFVLIALWRLARPSRRRPGRIADFVLAGGLLLCFWPPLAWLSVATLEKRYPLERFPRSDVQAIVALAGNSYPANASQPEAEPGFTTYLRTAHAAWLFHNWKKLPIVVTGGTGTPPIARLMRLELLAAGVPDAMILVEDQSTTTYENATAVAGILLPRGVRRIALVTEGFHMPRSERCFRKVGFDVTPAPCCYRTLELQSAREFLLPNLWAVRTLDVAVHEWIGLAWYKVRGRI
jgi:uncharacterized SAM-binding protein YcdF (DUF218 family)